MKKFIGGLTILSTIFILASCGGAEKDIVGKWHVDVSSVNIELGDAVPEMIKGEVDEAKSEMQSEEAQKEADKMTIDFQEGGKLVLSMEGEDEAPEASWTIDGDKLIIEGEIEGQSGKITLNIDEISGDKMTLSLTGEEIINQIKEQQPEALEMMKQMTGGAEVDKMAEGTKLSVSLKK